MNQAIAASVNSYFDYLMLIPGNVYWKDLKGVYLGCNLSMLDMVGLSSIQDVVGKTDYDLSWSESAGVLQKNDREVIRSEKLHSFEESTIFDNGSIITMISNKIPLVAKSGEVIGIIGSSIDISSLKKPAIPASCFEKSNGRESGQN